MKKIFFIIMVVALSLSKGVNAQTQGPYIPSSQKISWNEGKFTTFLGLPNDTFTVSEIYKNFPWIAVKNDSLYTWSTTLFKWNFTGVGGEAGANNYPTSLSFSPNTLTLGRNGLSDLTTSIVFQDSNFVSNDSLYMVRNGDTTFLGKFGGSAIDTTNKWLQNAYARNDSLFKVKNATETYLGKVNGTGHAIQDNGSPLTTRSAINFLPPLTAADNSGNNSSDVSIPQAGEVDGYLSSTDWAYFNNKPDTVLKINDSTLVVRYASHNDTFQLAGTGGDSVNIVGIKSVAQLKAVDYQTFSSRKKSSDDIPVAITLGRNSPGDGGDATYRWCDTCTTSATDRLYIKPNSVSGAGRWVYQPVNGVYNLKAMGVIEGDATKAHANRIIINSLINDFDSTTPDGYYRNRSIYTGRSNALGFYVDSTLAFRNKQFEFYSDANLGAMFIFPDSVVGIHVYGTFSSFGGMVFRNIGFYCPGSYSPGDGHISGHPDSARSEDPADYHFSGAIIEQEARFYNCIWANFSGHGAEIFGDIGAGSNTSLCRFEECEFQYNYGAGTYVHGGDANMIDFDHCTWRNNQWWSAYENGFLGDVYNGSHFTTNGSYGFIYVNRGTNASKFYGTYGESNPNCSVINSQFVRVDFTVFESCVTGAASTWDGYITNKLAVTKALSAPYGTSGFVFETNDNIPSLDLLHGSLNAKLHLRANPLGLGHYLMDDPSTFYMMNLGQYYKNFNLERSLGGTLSSWGFRHIIIGDKMYQVVDSVGGRLNIPYSLNDVLLNRNYNGKNALTWNCIRPGQLGSYSEGRTATTDGSQYVYLSGTTTVLQPGMTIVIGGIAGTIQNYYHDHTDTLFTDAAFAAGSGQTITYQTPIFKANVSGYGAHAQRPSLISDDDENDYGSRYYDTDSSAWFTYLSTGWVKDAPLIPPIVVTTTIQQVNGFDINTAGNIAIDTAASLNRLGFKAGRYWYHVAVTDSVDTYDADAATYINAVIAAGGTISVADQDAINTMFTGLKADGVWSDISAGYIAKWGLGAANGINFKSPGTYDLTSFSTGWTHTTSYSDPNGSSAAAHTGLNPNTVFGNNLIHIACYTGETSSSGIIVGNSNAGSSQLTALNMGGFGQSYAISGLYANRAFVAPEDGRTGMYVMSRTSTTNIQLYYNGTSLNTNTTSDATAPESRELYIGADNENGSANYYDNKRFEFISIGVGINSTKVTALTNRFSTFKTTIGR